MSKDWNWVQFVSLLQVWHTQVENVSNMTLKAIVVSAMEKISRQSYKCVTCLGLTALCVVILHYEDAHQPI